MNPRLARNVRQTGLNRSVRVAIDARPAISHGRTGVGHYARELILRLPDVDPQTRYVAWYLHARRLPRPWRWGRRFFPRRPNLAERWTPFPATWFARLEMERQIPRLEWLVRFDVLFAPNFVPPPTRTRRLVLTVHDLAFRLYPETAPHATRRWLEALDRSLHQAARIIVPSEATREDLLAHYAVDPERVRVIPHGVDPEAFRRPPEDVVREARRRQGIDGPYLLFLGGIEPRKNLPAIVGAFRALDGDVRLVIAGGSVPWNPEGRQLLEGALDGLPPPVRDRITLTGYLPEADKVALLAGAEALVFPSLYEGFGFPVLEAMAAGTPVLTSEVSSLPEVAGDAAFLVDPRSEESIAEGMERLLEDADLRARLSASGRERVRAFRWEDTARRTARVLHEAGG
jgi:glycosyltransferase involved in cell wall biosynthesis